MSIDWKRRWHKSALERLYGIFPADNRRQDNGLMTITYRKGQSFAAAELVWRRLFGLRREARAHAVDHRFVTPVEAQRAREEHVVEAPEAQ